MDMIRVTRMLTASFVGLVLVLTVVLVTMSGNWENPDDDLAQLGLLVSGGTGLIGVIAVIWWRNRATSSPQSPARFSRGFLLTTAVAEVGMLLGFVFAMASETLTPFWLGAALFIVSILILASTLSQVDVGD